jgi:hypothetical protein
MQDGKQDPDLDPKPTEKLDSDHSGSTTLHIREISSQIFHNNKIYF